MTELKNHPGFHLRRDAAIQFNLYEDHHGVVSVNRAAVSEADQERLIKRWDVGGKFNRPPYLYEPKRPARDSAHVQEIAVDTSHVSRMFAEAEPYGFYQRYSWDKPHFEFDPARVKITPFTNKESDMPVNVKLWLYTPTNNLILVDHLNKTMRQLGSSPTSGERAAFDKLPYTKISEQAWRNMVGAGTGFRYI